MSECERLISSDLALPFLGIEVIAKKLNISPSKLKKDFKLVYGTSILQYNIDKKMELALQLILNSNMLIKNISNEIGYDSSSKFSAAFKKRFQKLPSEFRLDAPLN